MALLFAQLEHQIRRTAASIGRGLADKYTGFSEGTAVKFLEDWSEEVLGIVFGHAPTARQLPADEPCDWQRDAAGLAKAEDHRGYYEATPTCGQEAETDMAGFLHACYRDPGHDGDHGCACGQTWPAAIYDGPPIDWQKLKVGEQYCALCGLNITAVAFHACPLRDQQALGRTYSLEDLSRLRDEQYDECFFCGQTRSMHSHPYSGACGMFIEPGNTETSADPTPPAEDDPAGFPEPAGSPNVPAGSSASEAADSPAGIPLTLTLAQEFSAADFLEQRGVGGAGYCLALVRDMIAATNPQAQQPK